MRPTFLSFGGWVAPMLRPPYTRIHCKSRLKEFLGKNGGRSNEVVLSPSNIQRNNCEYNKDSLSAKLCDITDIATKCGLGPP